MKKIIILSLICLLVSFKLYAQTFTKMNYNPQFDGLKAVKWFTLPDDTLKISDGDICKQMAKKNGIVYTYDCIQNKWVPISDSIMRLSYNYYSDPYGKGIQNDSIVYNQNGKVFNWITGTNNTLRLSKSVLSKPDPDFDTEVYSPLKLVNENNSLLLKMYGQTNSNSVSSGIVFYDFKRFSSAFANRLTFPPSDSMQVYIQNLVHSKKGAMGAIDTAYGSFVNWYVAGQADGLAVNAKIPITLQGTGSRFYLKDSSITYPFLPTVAMHKLSIGFDRNRGSIIGVDDSTSGNAGYLDTTLSRVSIYADNKPIKLWRLATEDQEEASGYLSYDGGSSITKGNVKYQTFGNAAYGIINAIDSVGGSSAAKIGRTLNVVPGGTYYAFGDSYTVGSLATSAERRYANIIAENTATILSNQGLAGLGIWRATRQAFSTMPVQDNNAALITVMAGYNDLRKNGSGDLTMATLENGYRSFIANAFLATAVAANSGTITKTGTWNTQSTDRGHKSQYMPGGAYLFSATAGATMTWNFTGNNVVVGMIAGNGTTFNYDSIRIQIDGTDYGWYQTNKGYNTENNSGPMAIVIRSLATGSHTLVLTKGASTTNVLVDYLGVMHNTIDAGIPPVVIGAVPAMLDSNYRYCKATYGVDLSDISIYKANNVIKKVVKEFQGYPISFVDVNTFFDIYNDIAYDSIHPTNKGHLHLANSFLSAITSYSKVSVTAGGGLHLDNDSIKLGGNVFDSTVIKTNENWFTFLSQSPTDTSLINIGKTYFFNGSIIPGNQILQKNVSNNTKTTISQYFGTTRIEGFNSTGSTFSIFGLNKSGISLQTNGETGISISSGATDDIFTPQNEIKFITGTTDAISTPLTLTHYTQGYSITSGLTLDHFNAILFNKESNINLIDTTIYISNVEFAEAVGNKKIYINNDINHPKNYMFNDSAFVQIASSRYYSPYLGVGNPDTLSRVLKIWGRTSGQDAVENDEYVTKRQLINSNLFASNGLNRDVDTLKLGGNYKGVTQLNGSAGDYLLFNTQSLLNGSQTNFVFGDGSSQLTSTDGIKNINLLMGMYGDANIGLRGLIMKYVNGSTIGTINPTFKLDSTNIIFGSSTSSNIVDKQFVFDLANNVLIMSNYKNNITNDSLLTTDENGVLKLTTLKNTLKYRHTGDNNLTITIDDKVIICDIPTTNRIINLPISPIDGQTIIIYVKDATNVNNWNTNIAYNIGTTTTTLLSTSQTLMWDSIDSKWIQIKQ